MLIGADNAWEDARRGSRGARIELVAQPCVEVAKGIVLGFLKGGEEAT